MFTAIRRKLSALVVAFAATLLALGTVAPTTALAAITDTTTGSVTVAKGTDNIEFKVGDTVKLYKIVNTTYNSDQNTVTSAWNDAVVDTTKTPDFATKWENQNYNATAAEVAQVRAALKDSAAAAATQAVTDGNVATFNGAGYKFNDLKMGQYLLVVETADSSRVFETTIVSVLPARDATTNEWSAPTDATAQLKGTTVTIDKKSNGKDEVTDKKIGDDVPFTITTVVPNYSDDAKDLVFTISDTMDKGVELKSTEASNFSIQANGANVNDAYYTLTATDKKNFSVAFTQDGIKALRGQTITVSYKGIITADAVVTEPGTNTAKLDYTNKPGTTASSTTDIVPVVTYGLQFKKVDGSDENKALSGAEFDIYDANKKVLVHATSDKDGVVKFDDLTAGTYYLKETRAPEGYQLRNDFIQVTLADAVQNKNITISKQADGTYTYTFAEGYDGYEKVSLDNGENYVKNVSNTATVLPTTGGPGTIALTAAGVVVMAGAATLIIRSRKNEK